MPSVGVRRDVLQRTPRDWKRTVLDRIPPVPFRRVGHAKARSRLPSSWLRRNSVHGTSRVRFATHKVLGSVRRAQDLRESASLCTAGRPWTRSQKPKTSQSRAGLAAFTALRPRGYSQTSTASVRLGNADRDALRLGKMVLAIRRSPSSACPAFSFERGIGGVADDEDPLSQCQIGYGQLAGVPRLRRIGFGGVTGPEPRGFQQVARSATWGPVPFANEFSDVVASGQHG